MTGLQVWWTRTWETKDCTGVGLDWGDGRFYVGSETRGERPEERNGYFWAETIVIIILAASGQQESMCGWTFGHAEPLTLPSCVLLGEEGGSSLVCGESLRVGTHCNPSVD